MRLEQRLRVVGIDLQASRPDVGESVDARLLVAGSRCERERFVAPLERLLLDLGEHRELREPGVRARELARLAERLENRDRIPRLAPRRFADAGEPMKARKDARAAADTLVVSDLGVQ